MSLSELPSNNQDQELEIQKLINAYIDKNECFVFNAGAGSGKTYALTESLRHIINRHGERLNHHNQKIMCITYTNVATNEIRERLGNTTLVRVSTIHERLWSIIKDYQKELVILHVEKLREELLRLKFDLNESSEEKEEKQFKVYRELPEDSRDEFRNIAKEYKKRIL